MAMHHQKFPKRTGLSVWHLFWRFLFVSLPGIPEYINIKELIWNWKNISFILYVGTSYWYLWPTWVSYWDRSPSHLRLAEFLSRCMCWVFHKTSHKDRRRGYIVKCCEFLYVIKLSGITCEIDETVDEIAYNSIPRLLEEYSHSQVNHSENFISPDDPTQNIESLWSTYKRKFRYQAGNNADTYKTYLPEFLGANALEAFHVFL